MNTAAATIITALIAGGGGWLLGVSGLLKARTGQKRESTEASQLLINEALALVQTFSTQVKDLRAANASIEQQQAHESQMLRERIRILEARVSELELENAHLKAQLYDGMGRQRGPSSPQG